MISGQNRALRMGTEPIPKLLLEFSVPVMTGMIVQALYSVINRAFIGNVPEIATLGMAAITVGIPIMLISLAFSMLIGFGGSAALSLYLGQKDQERAEKVLGNALTLAVIVALAVTVLGLLFLDPLLRVLGATDDVLPFARTYNAMMLIGTLPMIVGFGINNFIRAEGNPQGATFNMIASAVLNVALDVVFIVVLHWGVFGAALGGVLAQTFTAVLVLRYFFTKRSHVHFHWKSLGLDPSVAAKIASIGSSSFLMQVAASVVQFFFNGELMRYGGERALAAWGIIMTVMMFFLFLVFGLNGGSQPLVGFNYGAKNFLRVRTTAKWAVLAATVIVAVEWVIAQLGSDVIAGWFSGTDHQLRDMTALGLRLTSLSLPVVGFQVLASGYFNAVGKPLYSMFLATSRQVVFLLPAVWLLPALLGLNGIFWATPAADVLAAAVTLGFFWREMGRLKKQHHEQAAAAPEASPSPTSQ
jgi:putative MATE family efflux protein